MDKIKAVIVFGTRPEAVKMASLVRVFRDEPKVETVVAVTAQHREMLDQVMQAFEITADYDLDIMSHGQSLSDITCRVLEGTDRLFQELKPDIVLVQGDTTTTFAAALAAFYNKTAVGHVEAGLRTDDKYNPFPEEINRRLSTAIADLHFAPTITARDNLLREGVAAERVHVTGNTVIDSLLLAVSRSYSFKGGDLEILDRHAGRIVLVTAHRRENWGEPLRQITSAVKGLADRYPDALFIFPMHRNPGVRSAVKEVLGHAGNVLLTEPLDYEPFVHLMKRCHLILTDSGGVQEEAPSLGVPVLVLRRTTERPEAVEAGTARLVGTEREDIYRNAVELMDDPAAHDRMARSVNPYGDGLAAGRILDIILRRFGLKRGSPDEGCEGREDI